MFLQGFSQNLGDLYQEHVMAAYAPVSSHIVFHFCIKALQYVALNKHFVGLTWAYDVMLFWLTVIVCGLQHRHINRIACAKTSESEDHD